MDSIIFRQNIFETPRMGRWQRRDNPVVQEVEKHPNNQAHMYSAVTAKGAANLYLVTGTMGYKLHKTRGVATKYIAM